MTEQLSFSTDAAIIDRLGRELVGKQETALIELVKNAFDADATHVEVVLSGEGDRATLEIRDDGSGMSRATLLSGFMTLASDLKVGEPRSPKYSRLRAGQKGIGRFAVQRLGHRLILSTWAVAGRAGLRLTADWDRFTPGTDLGKIKVALASAEARDNAGTVIRIERLRDTWNDLQIRRAWRGILALQPPFPVAPVRKNDSADPGFAVRFVRQGADYADEEVVADFKTEILDHLPAVIEMKVDRRGVASWQLSKNAYGRRRGWRKIHHEHPETRKPPRYQNLRNVSMKAYYTILTSEEMSPLVFSRVKDVLSSQGGIRLYRNGFRVVPYGDPDNDWLHLDELYAKRDLLIPIGNRNFFGVVEVVDREGVLFDERTSREGLIETPAFAELHELASSVLVSAATAIGHDRGKKIRTGSPKPPIPIDSGTDAVEAAVKEAAEAAALAVKSKDPKVAREVAKRTAVAVKLLAREREERKVEQSRLADETAMLRLLATLGMTTAEFSHESGMTFDAFRLDFDEVFSVATEARPNDKKLMARIERARKMLNRLDTLTAYLNSLAGARAVREMRPISLKKAAREFRDGVLEHAESEGIELRLEAPTYDALFTRPMHEAEIASVLLNFYTNAVKAVRRTRGPRRVLIEVDRVKKPLPRVRIHFSDSGDGIPARIASRIFEAFFTTRSAPSAGAPTDKHTKGTGLGLWIVSQIATSAGGEVKLVDAPKGYSTCFELTLPTDPSDVS